MRPGGGPARRALGHNDCDRELGDEGDRLAEEGRRVDGSFGLLPLDALGNLGEEEQDLGERLGVGRGGRGRGADGAMTELRGGGDGGEHCECVGVGEGEGEGARSGEDR